MGHSLREIEAELIRVTQELDTSNARIAALENATLGGGGSQGTGSDARLRGGIFDKSLSMPEKLSRVVDFKEWSEDYHEYIDSQDEHLAELLTSARDSTTQITHMGATPLIREQAKAMYRSLKRSITQQDARSIVVTVEHKNPFEAWRLLFLKYDPRNDATAQTMIDIILDKARWKCSKLTDVPVKLVKWEALIREHLTRTGEEAVNVSTKRQLFRMMLPDDVRRFLEVQTMFRPGLTYDTIKQVVMDLVQRTADIPTPMDTNALGESPAGGTGGWQAPGGCGVPGQGGAPEAEPQGEANSFARGPAGRGPGKGAGKAGEKGKGKGEETRKCHNCDRVGHIARDCWRPKKVKGQGKGHDQPGRRERGPDGKWFRKTVNSWVVEEDQQNEPPWPE